MPREGKDLPSGLSQKRAKILQEMKDVLLLLSGRKVDTNVMAIDQPGSAANGSTEIRPNEQNVNASTTAHGQPDSRTKSVCALFCPFFIPRFPDLRSDDRAKAKDDAWAAVTRFHNAYQETAVRVLKQLQKAKGMRRAGPEEDLRVSELPKICRAAGGEQPCIVERLGEGFDRRAQSSQPPVERASLQSAVSHAYYLVLLMLRRT